MTTAQHSSRPGSMTNVMPGLVLSCLAGAASLALDHYCNVITAKTTDDGSTRRANGVQHFAMGRVV